MREREREWRSSNRGREGRHGSRRQQGIELSLTLLGEWLLTLCTEGLVGEVAKSERRSGVEDGGTTDGTQLVSGSASMRLEELDETLGAVGMAAVGAASSLEDREADRTRQVLVLLHCYAVCADWFAREREAMRVSE